LHPVLGLIFLAIVVTCFGCLLIWGTSKLGPKPRSIEELGGAYECGMAPVVTTTKKISVNYYLTAVLFVLLDIEIIFLYPLALVYKDFIKEGRGLYIFLGLAVFLTIFIIGLFWEVRTKALKWT
jgi:NADH-quinone oxidoreductase subunit A